MKGVIAADLILVLGLVGCLYMLWLHDEQIRQLEMDYFNLLENAKPKPRSRAKPSEPAPTNGKVDE